MAQGKQSLEDIEMATNLTEKADVEKAQKIAAAKAKNAAIAAAKTTWENRQFTTKAANQYKAEIIGVMKEAGCNPADKYVEVYCPESRETDMVSVPAWKSKSMIERDEWPRKIWKKIPVEVLVNMDAGMSGPFKWDVTQVLDADGIPVSDRAGNPKVKRVKAPHYEYICRSCDQKES